nr:two-component response regulator-like PRR95 isoform X1 [Ziziphus jujuba var. spinosa]
MGEVVVSGEQDMVEMREAEKSEQSNKKGKEEDEDGGSTTEMVRWEKYLPRMVLRVLLVEADDSTRQIISALLRKCSYRVSAVPDGLKAWETLKGKPHNIDLILTEVELPAISGFALLSLVMEHDICKNIPVIMMSSQDSISMVLKCMLKGAADYLIKPVRRNELRNLWQHVWRRHTLLGRQFPQDMAMLEHKVEATSENNAASSHSSDAAASMQKTRECSEKGSDVQSTCTTPYLEAENICVQNMQDISRLKCGNASNLSNTDMERHEECTKMDEESVMLEIEEGEKPRFRMEDGPCSGVLKSTALRLEPKLVAQNGSVQPESFKVSANVSGLSTEIQKNYVESAEPSCGVIDLIGKFDNRSTCIDGRSAINADGLNNSECAPQLELSLRRICTSNSNNQGAGERLILNHSNASAFSLYNNSKTSQPLIPVLSSNCSKSEDGAHELLFSQSSGNSNNAMQHHGAATSNCQETMASSAISQSGQTKSSFPSPQLGLIPVTGLRFDNVSPGYGQFFPSLFYTQQSASSIWSPKSACQREKSPFPTSGHSNPDTHTSEKGHHHYEETINNSVDQDKPEHDNFDTMEELRPGSPTDEQNASSNLSNGAASHISGVAYGTSDSRGDGNGSSGMAVEKATAPQSVNDTSHFIHEGFKGMDSLRSSQREAALTKFRLKRKDRCFEKKVRYQSRKRLAEQRPRVKGQFVRQAQADSPVVDADGS